MSDADFTQLPGIALTDGEPIFNEPWEAQAFAMVVNLHQRGAFEWSEWAECLSEQIHSGEERSYYQHWLTALETIADKKNLASTAALQSRKQAWHDAAACTPHGDPITLD